MFPEGRMFDFLIVGVVALIVVGPKDLPVLMRKVGQFMARVRGMAGEFRAGFDEMGRHAELDALRRDLDALRTGATSSVGLSAMGFRAGSGGHKVFDDIETGLKGRDSQVRSPSSDDLAARAASTSSATSTPAERAPAVAAEATP
jgi:sec-independent protein translocase protein TatB